jgi:hypothetical protein
MQCSKASLFDHLVSKGKQLRRNIKPKRLCRLDVDHQLELRRLLDRQIGRLGAIEDFRGVDAELAISIEIVGSIAYKSAGLYARRS